MHAYIRVGQNHTYKVFLAGKSPYIRSYTVYIYSIFGREIIKYTVIYGVYIRFWPTLACIHSNTHTHAHMRAHTHTDTPLHAYQAGMVELEWIWEHVETQ